MTFQNLDSITSEMLENLHLITGQIVTTSTKEGKIIDNFECYIAISTKSDEAKKAKIGDNVKLKLATNKEIPAEVARIKEEKDERLVIFKINQGVEYLTGYRKISLDIIWWKEQGLRVPNSSIIYENGLSYIIRIKSRRTKKSIS